MEVHRPMGPRTWKGSYKLKRRIFFYKNMPTTASVGSVGIRHRGSAGTCHNIASDDNDDYNIGVTDQVVLLENSLSSGVLIGQKG
jgi:hypothetical protein